MPRIAPELRQQPSEDVQEPYAVLEMLPTAFPGPEPTHNVSEVTIRKDPDAGIKQALQNRAGLADKILGPLPESQDHPLTNNQKIYCEWKRSDEGDEIAQQEMEAIAEPWHPDPVVLAKLGLKGETAEEVAAQLEPKQSSLDDLLSQELNNEEIENETPQEEFSAITNKYIVPLEEQLLPGETSISEEEIESQPEETLPWEVQPKPSVSPRIVRSINDRPWADWSAPDTATASLHSFRIRPSGDRLAISTSDGNILGFVADTALDELGKRVTFPAEFIQKLSPTLAAQVVNERIQAEKDMEMTAVIQDGEWTNLLPAWRGILPTRRTADIAYDTLKEHYPEIEIEQAVYKTGSMLLKLLTPVVYPVTPAVGDTLRMGIDVAQQYGGTIAVQLYVKRLVCLNGMTANERAFSWRKRTGDAGSVEEQAEWVKEGVLHAVGSYTALVEKAQTMAQTHFEGDYTEILRERASAMRLPMRHLPALINAFEAEVGNTEWNLVNAFSRLATHGGLPGDLSRALQYSSGEWLREFSLVNARLPRPIAERVGARIINE